MRVDQVFKRAGFEIVGAHKDESIIVFDVRVPLRDLVPARWTALLGDILPVAEKVGRNPVPKWELEVTKRFYSQNGSLRYLWRVTMRGNLAACQAAIVAATINTLRVGHELTEVPLIGQLNVAPDPKNGRFKGAYPRNDDDRASQAVASAFIAGG